jgi:hypothetical protein
MFDLMREYVHNKAAIRVLTYLKGARDNEKPVYPIDTRGTFEIYSGIDKEGNRMVIRTLSSGTLGDALLEAIHDANFYAHHRSIEHDVDDDPASKNNGYVKLVA